MSGIYGTLDAAAIRAHVQALERFAAWERSQKVVLAPSEIIAAIAFLFELLPMESRGRPVDVSGVMQMHRCLAVLAGSEP